MSIIIESNLKLPLFGKGKVRDTYRVGDKLMMVCTDRISAYDYVLPTGIPDKGVVLNQISIFWFAKTYHIIHNHMVESVESQRALKKYSPGRYLLPEWVMGRSMVVYKAERIPVECVVRGYLAGSAWAEYQESGTINGQKMGKGMVESQELPEPLFTPTTKADKGHDIALNKKELSGLVGATSARELEEKSLALYSFAREYAAEKGIIIADTKFEFGYLDGDVILIDEVLTPDSSRFWDAHLYEPGQPQASYDKQPVRDWLVKSGWNRRPPAPALSRKVVAATTERYHDAYLMLTAKKVKNVFG